MQFKYDVPTDSPLVHEDNGIEIWVVVNYDDQNICGCFFSPARAAVYIKDWYRFTLGIVHEDSCALQQITDNLYHWSYEGRVRYYVEKSTMRF